MRWPALLLSLAACTSVTELPRPPDDGARAVVTFYLAGADVVAADAADFEPGWGPPSFSGAAGVTELVVVELGCPLATLGLAPGEQELGSATDAPAFVSAYRMVLDVGAWTAVDEVDDLLGRLPFAYDPGCPVLTRVEIGEPIDYGVGLEDGTVLVATATRLLQVSIDGSVSTFGERPARTFAATRTAELLWLVADDAVWRGSMVTGFERIPLSNGESTDRGWVDGTSGFGAAELVVVTKSGVGLVYREGATAWDRGPFNGNAVSPWVNPREGLPYAGVLRVSSLDMFTAGGQRLVHSRIRPRPQPCTDRVEFTGMVQMPNGEILVGDVDGEISLVRTDQVRPVCDASPPTSTVGPTLERLLSFDVRPMNDIGVFDGALLALLPDSIAIRREATLQCAPETVIGQRVLERTVDGAAIREEDAVVFVRKSPCTP